VRRNGHLLILGTHKRGFVYSGYFFGHIVADWIQIGFGGSLLTVLQVVFAHGYLFCLVVSWLVPSMTSESLLAV